MNGMNPFYKVREEEIKTAEGGILVPRKAIVNEETNKVVSVVGENYHLVTNQELINNFEDYLKESDVKFTRITSK